jgi:hypothetical protein
MGDPARGADGVAEVGRTVDEIDAVPCRTSDPEAWWPDRRELDDPATRTAVQACWRCPAREACLDYAVAADEAEGIWGGALPDERRRRPTKAV